MCGFEFPFWVTQSDLEIIVWWDHCLRIPKYWTLFHPPPQGHRDSVLNNGLNNRISPSSIYNSPGVWEGLFTPHHYRYVFGSSNCYGPWFSCHISPSWSSENHFNFTRQAKQTSTYWTTYYDTPERLFFEHRSSVCFLILDHVPHVLISIPTNIGGSGT